MSENLAEGLVPMELREIQISAVGNDPQVVVLGEADGPRTFPIFIGRYEAMALDDAVRGIHAPRPMTHDLIVKVLQALRAPVVRCAVVGIKGDTFFGAIDVKSSEGGETRIDCRPSDALVIAAKVGAPLFVHESVLRAVASPVNEDDQASALGLSFGAGAASADSELSLDELLRDDSQMSTDEIANDLLRMLGDITGELGAAPPEEIENELIDDDVADDFSDLSREDGSDENDTQPDDDDPDFGEGPERHHR